MTSDEPQVDQQVEATADLVVEALSRENGKNHTIRVYPDRIEWLQSSSISSLPRPKDQPPVIPLDTVMTVKAKKDGPLFSKLVLRTTSQTMVFRMYTPQAVQMRDAITGLLEPG